MPLIFLAALCLSLVVVGVAFALGSKSIALLGAPFGLAALPLVLRYPQVILLAMVFLIPLDVLAALPGGAAAMTLNKLFFPAAMGILFLQYLVKPDRRVGLHPIDRWLLVWALYTGLGVAMAVDRDTALDEFRRLGSMWLLYFVLSRAFVEPAWQRRLLAVVRISVATSILVGMKSYFAGSNPFSHMATEGASGNMLVRITGASDITPNLFAAFILLPLSTSLYAIVGRRGWPRFWGFAGAGIMVIGLVLTYSRSAFLVMAIMLVLFVITSWKHIPASWLATGLFGFLACLPLVPGRYWQRMATLIAFNNSEGGDYSMWRRTNYLKVAKRIIEDHPLFGCGPGNFRVLHSLAEYQQEVSLIGVQRVAHNMYVTVVTESGIIGVVIFLGMWFVVLRSGWRLTKIPGEVGLYGRTVLLALVGLLMIGVFQITALNKYLWIMLAMIRALSERAGREALAVARYQQAVAASQAAAEQQDSPPMPGVPPPQPQPALPSGWPGLLERALDTSSH